MKLSGIFVAIILFFVIVNTGGTEMKVWDGEYVPAPQPVKSKLMLGVYIFPGWYRDKGRGDYPYRTHDEDSEWKNCVAKQPKPRALLGFYDDSLPEVNDWHIKWALEHGISWFAFDWYWNAGEKRLARTLEKGFLKAKYSNLMKFCINWCNHGLDWKKDGKPAELDFSREALVEMTSYLADNYFKLPNYLTIDGRPVLIIWDSNAIITANDGPSGFRETLKKMNEVLRSKGMKDIYLVSLDIMSHNRGLHEKSRESGFSAMTGYGYYGVNPDSKYEWKKGYSVLYEDLVKYHERIWKEIASTKEIPYILSFGSNWDDRPRAGGNAIVITGKTPEKFKIICENSLKYIDKNLNMAVIEAWNEWGEGGFIEPDKEWNFSFLDVVRDVFTDATKSHIDYLPPESKILSYSVLNDAELAKAREKEKKVRPDPPFLLRAVQVLIDKPLPNSELLKQWEFDSDSSEGWRPYQVEPFEISDGVLTTTPTGDDPQIIADDADLNIEEIGCIALKSRMSKDIYGCELFWTTPTELVFAADKSFVFPFEPDGKWHTYQISKQVGGKWKGMMKALRFDIGGPGDKIEVDWVRIYKGKPQKQSGHEKVENKWEFNEDGNADGWKVMMNLEGDVEVAGGALKGTSTSNDPAFFISELGIKGEEFPFVIIRMKVSKDSSGGVYWLTDSSNKYDEPKSCGLSVKGDGEFHEYKFPVGENILWSSGIITELRFDPASEEGITAEIDYIRLAEK